MPSPDAYYSTQHVYADHTTSTVFSTIRPEGMVTTVTDGPLHDCLEITSQDPGPDALRQQHCKWVWRVLHAEQTRAEWFRRVSRRAKSQPPNP